MQEGKDIFSFFYAKIKNAAKFLSRHCNRYKTIYLKVSVIVKLSSTPPGSVEHAAVAPPMVIG